MGVNNWSECHQCKRLAETQLETAMADLEAKYGKIPAEDYKLELQKLSAPLPAPWAPRAKTRREDWEVILDESGYLSIKFSASCSKCLWSRGFQHEEQL